MPRLIKRGVRKPNATPSMIARILRDYRLRMNLTQEQLSQRAAVDRTYVGKIERGMVNPTLLRISPLLRAMGVTWREFGEILDRELDAANESHAAGRVRRPPVRSKR